MRVLVGGLLIALLSACVTGTGGVSGRDDQAISATAGWSAAYNSRDPARYTMVFRNRNGKWLIVAHHSSEVP